MRALHWTPEEDDFIIRNYSRMTLHKIADRLGRPFPNLQNHTYRLIREGRLDPRKRFYSPRWTAKEIEYLQEKFGLVSDERLARKFRRTVVGIRLKAKRLGLTKKQNMFTQRGVARVFGVDDKVVRHWIYVGALPARKGPWSCGPEHRNRVWVILAEDLEHFIKNAPHLYECGAIDREEYPFWRNLADEHAFDGKCGGGPYKRPRKEYSAQEDRYILENYRSLTCGEIATGLGRPRKSIGARIIKLRKNGVAVPRIGAGGRAYRGPNRWTREEVSYLRQNYGRLRRSEISSVVGHTPEACTAKAMQMGLTRRGANQFSHIAMEAEQEQAA